MKKNCRTTITPEYRWEGISFHLEDMVKTSKNIKIKSSTVVYMYEQVYKCFVFKENTPKTNTTQ